VNLVVLKTSENISKKVIQNYIIKNQLTIILQCSIENPIFDSQTKEMLTSKILTNPIPVGMHVDLFKQLQSKTEVIENIKSKLLLLTC
jgi:DNA gyrase/topoisomerase IV subunit B